MRENGQGTKENGKTHDTALTTVLPQVEGVFQLDENAWCARFLLTSASSADNLMLVSTVMIKVHYQLTL